MRSFRYLLLLLALLHPFQQALYSLLHTGSLIVLWCYRR